MARKKKRPEIGTESERLLRLRKALGFPTSASFAGYLGPDISAQRYNAYENGTPLSKQMIIRLCQRVPGLTSDWLLFGNSDQLTVDLARRLGELPSPGKRTTA